MYSGGGNFDMNAGDRMMSGGMSNMSSMNRNFNRMKKIDDNPFEQEMEEQDAWSQTMNNRSNNRLSKDMDFRAGGSDDSFQSSFTIGGNSFSGSNNSKFGVGRGGGQMGRGGDNFGSGNSFGGGHQSWSNRGLGHKTWSS